MTEKDNADPCDQFWQNIEEETGSHIPSYIRNVLRFHGFNSSISIKILDDDDLNDMEKSVRSGIMTSCVSGSEASVEYKEVYGPFAKNLENFSFLRGFRKALLAIARYIREKELRNIGRPIMEPSRPLFKLHAPVSSNETISDESDMSIQVSGSSHYVGVILLNRITDTDCMKSCDKTDDKAEDSTQEVKPEDDKKESKGSSVKGAADNGTKKKAKDDKSESEDKNEPDSAEEDGDDNADDNDDKSDTKKINEKKKPVANNDKKKPSLDAKKDDGKANSKNSNSVNDKKEDDDTAKSSDKKESAAMSLGEIARIDSYITNTKVDSLQVLHSICFTGNAKPNMIKNKLRKFSGFEFDADSDEYNTKLESVQKIDIAKLKGVCEGLTLDKKGSKDELAERICEFLLAPDGERDDPEDDEAEDKEEEEEEEEQVSSEEDTKKKKGRRGGNVEEKVSKGGRPRRATAGRTKDVSSYVDYSSSEEEEKYVRPKTARRGKNRDDTDSGYSDAGKKRSLRVGRGRPPARRAAKRRQSDSEDESPPTSEEDSDAPPKKKKAAAAATGRGRGRPTARGRKKESESEEEESDLESEDSDDKGKRKVSPRNNKSSNNKSKNSSSPAKSRGRPARAAATKAKSNKNDATSEEEDEEEPEVDEKDEESEDEPLSKKAKTAEPTDDEIKSYVKEILDEANLEEITMKTVCKQVYAKYPSFDLAHKKDFIKSTVKSLIAT